MAASLDRCKISDRDAVHILLATAESFGININELIINRTSVNSIRQRFRKNRIEALRVNFNPSQIGLCVVHWDGKLLPSLSEKKLVDRLPIIISYMHKAAPWCTRTYIWHGGKSSNSSVSGS